ncbi:ATP-NAD kinase family protein [Ruminococcaceae bacterium OttesenSCG-928-I18]|nr:ATP-NAD kinase family protein [Ruminococcaceae bacterium OttesenSCG-928-I18]
MKKKLGLVINPVAGVGGAVGLKGSDGPEIQKMALERGAVKKSGEKTSMALMALESIKEEFTVYAAPGEMGADLAESFGFETVVVGDIGDVTTAADTERIAGELAGIPVDVLLFAGGDGTARNVCEAVPDSLPVVGVPAGVKIHSAVYATSPTAAGKALYACLTTTVQTRQAEVMDIDEEMYRAGQLQAKLYGYLSVPVIRGVMQNPKAASHNNANDVGGICEEMKDRIERDADPEECFIFGAGSTVTAVESFLGLDGTLLGIDVYQNGKFLAKDVAEKELLEITKKNNCKLIITAIGGQGHIFGRGNQQLSPSVIRQIGLDNLWVVAAASKIYSLPDQCLYVDTGDAELNEELRGYRKVIVGWQETLVCEVR